MTLRDRVRRRTRLARRLGQVRLRQLLRAGRDPDFLLLGAMKSGTTSLFDYLCRHPDIAPGIRKEVHYFDNDFDHAPAWYRAHFPEGPALTGEASPYYLFHPLAPARAAARLPDARLLAILRDPIERAWSHYQHNLRKGREPRSFEEAIEAEPAMVEAETRRLVAGNCPYSFPHHRFSYLSRGFYHGQLQAWLEHFPRDRLLVVFSDDLEQHPEQVLDACFAHLGVAPWKPPEALPRRNFHGGYAPLGAETRARLERLYQPHDQALADWLGSPLPWRPVAA